MPLPLNYGLDAQFISPKVSTSCSLSFALPLLLPLPLPCCASCIVCILARSVSEPSFPLSHNMDFFLFPTSSAKSNSWCQQNMFFISWKMYPTKTHVAENVHSEPQMSLTAPDKSLLNAIKIIRGIMENNQIWITCQTSRFRALGCL